MEHLPGGRHIDSGMVVNWMRAQFHPGRSPRSTDFPTSPDALDSEHNGEGDAFLVKLDASGPSLLYGSYMEARPWTRPGAGADPWGDAVVAGWTVSANFPTTEGAFDPTFNAGQDGFVLRLDGLGDRPHWRRLGRRPIL